VHWSVLAIYGREPVPHLVTHAVTDRAGCHASCHASIEAADEDAVSRSDILKTLCGMWPGVVTTAYLAERLRAIAEQVKNGASEKPEMTELRRFCTAAEGDNARFEIDRGRADCRRRHRP
jgi:hypothetical protein